MYLADSASSYISKKTDDLPIEPDEIKSYTVQVILMILSLIQI